MLLGVTLLNQIVHNSADAALMLQMARARETGRTPTLKETWPLFKGELVYVSRERRTEGRKEGLVLSS